MRRWRLWVVVTAAVLGWWLPRAALAATLAPNNEDEIVYLDPNGVIHAYDPVRPNNLTFVEWQSPTGGWTHVQTADFNNDGDAEIVAVGVGASGPLLTIFDPVARDLDPTGLPVSNGVPWTTIYEQALPGTPRVLLVGEFDPDRTGPEIFYGYALDLPDMDRDRFVLMRQLAGKTDGRAWDQFRAFELEGVWNRAAAGDVGRGVDVIALVDNERGRLETFRVSPDVLRIFRRVNTGERWRDVAFGQFNSGGTEELGAVREAELPLATAWVFRYDGSTFVDDFAASLSPGPLRVFFADIGGNGDDEMVMIRQVQVEFGPRPRLIIRDRGNDTLGIGEVLLDGDNEYQGGTGGDIDGDGRDEIIIVRNNRLRYFTEPERSAASIEHLFFTDGETVVTGNLDAVGLGTRSSLFAGTTLITASLQTGAVSAPVSFSVFDAINADPLPFTYRVEGAKWVTVTTTGNTLPVSFTVTLHAAGLADGTYTGRLIVDAAGDSVDNDPWVVNLQLTVDTGVSSTPTDYFFAFDDCAQVTVPKERILQLAGPASVIYTLSFTGSPEWVTVAPEAGSFPEDVLLTVDPTLAPGVINLTYLRVAFDLPNAPGLVQRVPIILTCGAERLALPLLRVPTD